MREFRLVERWTSALARSTSALAPGFLLLGLWQGLCLTGWFSPAVLVPPGKLVQSFCGLVGSGVLLRDLEASFGRVLLGYAVGAGLGLALGAVMGVFPRIWFFCRLVFTMIRQVPSIAWVPILMLAFGFQETFKIVLIAKAAFFPVALNTVDGIRGIRRADHEVADLFLLSPWKRFRCLILPSSLPAVATGLRLGLSRAWMMLVAAELFASSVGIGHRMDWGRQLFHIDIVMVGVVVTAVIGFSLDFGLAQVENRLTRWRGRAAS